MGDELPQQAEGRPQVLGPGRQSGLVTLLFSDVVGSTALKGRLGDRAGVELLQQHHTLVREVLAQFKGAEEIVVAGDSFLVLFPVPSEGVKCALVLQRRLEQFNRGRAVAAMDRMGLHMGEVRVEQTSPGKRDVHGLQVDTCARVMGLAQAGQILLTRPVFDNARQSLRGEEIEGITALTWLNHGRFELKGVEAPVEICEVFEAGRATPSPPTTSEKAHRVATPEEEPVLGWRPAVGQLVPNTQWALEQKLGEGGFGEVWLGRHLAMKERRVFKFCFRAERVRALKREMTLFRLIKERIGDHANIVRLLDVYFEQPPFYVEEEYVAGKDLARWSEEIDGADKMDLALRLEIVAQIADALQAAHDAGVIHRDVKPANILVSNAKSEFRSPKEKSEAADAQVSGPNSQVVAKLTDFGIGQVISEDVLKGVTRAGFTKTLSADSSSSHTGSQMYMAPELLAGKPASTRSDIYSLGVVLYQVLVGDFRQPVTTDWANDIPDELLRQDLRQCLAGKPEDRFDGAAQLGKHLRNLEPRRMELTRRAAEEAERARLCRQANQRRQILLVSAGVVSMLLLLAMVLAFGLRKAEQARRLQRRYAYASDMKAAQVALEQKNRGLAASLLRRYFPKTGEEDLRDVEWRYLWQESLGEEFRSFRHSPMVITAALSPDNRLVATVSRDFTVRVWEAASARMVQEFQASRFRWDIRKSVQFSPDGKWLAAPGKDGIDIRDTERWQVVHELKSAEPPLCFSPDGQLLVALGTNGLLVCHTGDWTHQVLTNIFADCNSISFAGNGSLMAYSPASYVWRRRGLVHLHDLRTGSDAALEGETEAVSVALSPDAKWLASGNLGGGICVWNLEKRQLVLQFQAHRTLVAGLAFSPDSRMLATGGNDQLIHFWETGTTNRVRTLEGHLSEIWSLDFSRDGETLISGSKDGTARLWGVKQGRPKSQVLAIPPEARPLGGLPDGSVFVTLRHDARTTEFWSLPEGRLLESTSWRDVDAELGRDVAFFPENHSAVGVSSNGALVFWDITTKERLRSVELGERNFVLHLLSPDNHWAFGAVTGRGCLLVDLRTARRVQQFSDVQMQYQAGAFSADGRLLAYSTPDYTIKVWDLMAHREKATLAGHTWRILSFRFSPDSTMLASGGIDAQAWVWSVESGQPLRSPLSGHLSGVMIGGFSSDSRTLITLGDEGTARWWNIATGREMLLFQGLALVRGIRPSSFEGKPESHDLLWREETGTVRVSILPTLEEVDAARKVNSPGLGR